MKTIALTAAAVLIAGSAFAQKAPVPQTGNLDASTETQIEQTEGATKQGKLEVPKIDLNTTQATSKGKAEEGVPAFKDPGNLESSTKDNLQGK